MGIGYSRVDLMGNLGINPRVGDGGNGKLRVSFSMAVNRAWTDADGERREETSWFSVVAWGRVAEVCRQLLSKGSWVFVTGRLQARRWQDEDSNWHKITEVVAREVILLRKAETDAQAGDDWEESLDT